MIPHPDDIVLARRAIRDAKHFASLVKGYYWARMNPSEVPWFRAAELVAAAESVAYHASWLVETVEVLAKESAARDLAVQRSRLLGLIRSHSGPREIPVR